MKIENVFENLQLKTANQWTMDSLFGWILLQLQLSNLQLTPIGLHWTQYGTHEIPCNYQILQLSSLHLLRCHCICDDCEHNPKNDI